jgi:synaptic vesicle membrane protein VAT-1
MRAIRIAAPGGYDALQLVSGPDPQPAAGQVRIRVAACGVNYADGIIRMGLYASAKQLHGYPIVPGFEVAGSVDRLGAGVDGLQEGDEVVALTLFGGYADCVVVPQAQVFRRPAALSMVQAAAIPTVFLTAWFMVHQQLHARPGDRWLVHSAAGGVGSALVQLGRLAGCEVVAVVGAGHKVAAARAAGAAAVIDKSQEPLWPRARALAPDGYHAVFDANGVETLRASYRHLAPTGVLAIYGFHTMLPRDGRVRWWKLARDWLRTPRFNPLDMTQSNRSVVAANLSFLQSESSRLREGMLWLWERFERGALQPPAVTTYPLAQAAEAQRRIESGQTVGKLVLTTAD